MKLELKHLAPYLPYELKFKSSIGIRTLNLETINYWDTGYYLKLKPILRPLSDLDKEIDHNEEKFIPYDALKTIVSDEQWVKICETINEPIYTKVFDMPYWWVNKIYSWHFDVFGLIEEGLAIDINTLKK